MQHNSWKKDRDLLSEAYTQINEGFLDGADEGNILERLEELSHTFDDTRESHEEWAQIIIDFKDIIDDINSLEAPDQKIDAVELGLHLARLAPDTTKGSALP